MANGKLGDHPLTDIVIHGAETFTPEIDAMVKEVHGLGGFESELASLYLLGIDSDLKDADPARRKSRLSWLRAALERERDRFRLREHVRKGGGSG